MAGETNSAVTAAVGRVWSQMTTDRGDVYAFGLVVLGVYVSLWHPGHEALGTGLVSAGLLGLRLKT